MNTKHKVLNGTMNLFLSLKLHIWKCKNKKKQTIQKFISLMYYNQGMLERQEMRAVFRAIQI